MTESALLQIAAPAAVVVLGTLWAIVRYELRRYAKAHPASPIVKDALAVIAEAQAIAPVLGVTGPKVAGFISGALAASGHPVPAQAVLAAEQAVAAAAATDLARVPATPPALVPPPAPAVAATPPAGATVASTPPDAVTVGTTPTATQ